MKRNLKLTCLSLAIISPLASATVAPDNNNRSAVLPFFSEQLVAQGYDLPEPFGVNINYNNMRQNVNVDSVNLTGFSSPLTAFLPSAISPESLLPVTTGHTRMRSTSTTVKLDAFLLPFLNVYALAGKTHGHSTSQISIDTQNLTGILAKIPPSPVNPLSAAPGLAGAVAGISKVSSFTLNFKGTTYGAGIVLSAGYKNLFGVLDTNFTQTTFDVLDGHINAFTLSPRAGYSFTMPAIKGNTPGKLNVWAGTMYQNTQQTYRGKLSDLGLPASLAGLTGNNARFEVKQHLSSPWNLLLGVEYAITRNVNITTEVGFARRNSVLVSGEYRF